MKGAYVFKGHPAAVDALAAVQHRIGKYTLLFIACPGPKRHTLARVVATPSAGAILLGRGTAAGIRQQPARLASQHRAQPVAYRLEALLDAEQGNVSVTPQMPVWSFECRCSRVHIVPSWVQDQLDAGLRWVQVPPTGHTAVP